jgi:colanic acid/amylovoran biosynthesis glycosyltransferase
LKIAYLLNTYPLPSTTFIRREILALEKLGVKIQRYAARRWEGGLVDEQDLLEEKRTHYLLTGNLKGLLSAFALSTLQNPKGMQDAARICYKLWRSGGGVARHLAYLLEACYFMRAAKREGITHVHAHFATNAAAVCLLSKLLGGPSYSFTVHGPDEFVDSTNLSYPLKVEHAKFVAAISYYCRSQIALAAKLTDLSKIVIVRCGLDLEDFPLQASEPLSSNLVCVGRLCPQKGQVFFPELVARLRPEFPELRLTLVGDGEDREKIQTQIAALNVADMITLVGWQSNTEVRSHIRAGRALLLPSYAEGLPVVIMEALALGRPVISTYIAGIPELVTPDCGWLVPAGSIDDLERVVRELLNTKETTCLQKGVNGRKRVEQFHDISVSAQTLAQQFSLAIEPN